MLKTTHGTKLLKAAEDAAEGTVRVAFAQLNVVDHDGDVTIPGAFEQGAKVKVCQTGHAHGDRVAGAGVIIGEERIGDADWAVAELKFFLNTEAGREEFETIKALNDLGHTQEFSYGYDILDAEHGVVDGKQVQILKSLGPYEISPVLRGAGIGTHQLAVKAVEGECPTCGTKAVTVVEPEPDVVEGSAKLRDAEASHLQFLQMKARRNSARHVPSTRSIPR